MINALPFRLPSRGLLRDVVTTYAGFLTNAVFGFVTLRLVATHLGPWRFGLACIANIFMAVVAGLGEPGIGTALVRLAARPEMSREAREELTVAAVRLKLIVSVGVCGLVYLLMPWITTAFMHRPTLTPLLRCCLVGAVTLTLASFAQALFQMQGAFRENAATIAAAGAVRAAAVVGLCWTGRLTLWTAVGAMVLMNVVQFALCVYALRRLLFSLPWHCRAAEHLGELLGYTKCLVVWLVVGTFHPRADMMLLTHYISDNRVLGFYAAAGQICWVVPQLSGSVALVLLPRISALRTHQEINRAMSRCRVAAIVVLVLLTPLALWGGSAVVLIFGPGYSAAIPVFRLLLLAAAVELALNPLTNFWHALNQPGMLSTLNVGRLSLLMLIAMIAIPRIGMLGAALAVMVAAVVPLTAQGAILWVRLYRQPFPLGAPADAALTKT